MHDEQNQSLSVYMGYASIEALLDGRDPADTLLYIFSACDAKSTQYGNFHHRSYYILVSLIESNVVHYCRLNYGAAQIVSDYLGEPVGDCQREVERIEKRGASLDALLREHIARRGFSRLREAAPAFPASMQLVGGSQRFASLSEDRSRFVESEVTS